MICILSGSHAAASAVAHTSVMAVMASALSRTWPLLIRWITVAMVSSYLRSARNVKPEDAEALEDIFRAAYNRLVRER